MATSGSTTCLRCGSGTVGTAGPTRVGLPCPQCGFVLQPDTAAQLDYLDSLETWIGVRRAEVIGAALEPSPSSSPPEAPATVVRPRSRVTAAGFLLTVGAFALVAAGLAFTAFAWDLIGPLGQLIVLVLIGSMAMVAGWLMASRVPGTATALSITGVLLLVVAAGFLLSTDSAGVPSLRAAGVTAAACLGVAVGYRQARRQPAAAVVTSSVFAGLATAALTFAPTLPPSDDVTWSGWWASAALLLAGAAMLGLELARARIRTPGVPWAGLGTSTVVIGVLVGAATTADRASSADPALPAGAIAGGIMLVGALALVGIARLMRRWSPLLGAAVLVAGSLLALLGAQGDPPSRGWYAALAASIAVLLGLVAVHLDRREQQEHPEKGARSLVAALTARLATVAGGLSVAIVAAAGASAPTPSCTWSYEDEPCVDAATTVWLESLHPWWAGALVGAAAAVLAAVTVVVLRRTGRRADDIPVVAAGSVIAGWLVLALGDSTMRGADPSVVEPASAAVLVVGGLGTLLVLALARWVLWTMWLAAAVASIGLLVGAVARDVPDLLLGPEVLGVLLALPPALVGFLAHRRLGPATSTWATVGPALTVALVPPVLSVVGATFDRAFADGPVEAAHVVREVLVLATGVLLAALGARMRWSAVFWPGIVTVALVVGVQLMEASTQVPQWVWLSVAGAVLMLVGARWEWARRQGHRTRVWSATLR